MVDSSKLAGSLEIFMKASITAILVIAILTFARNLAGQTGTGDMQAGISRSQKMVTHPVANLQDLIKKLSSSGVAVRGGGSVSQPFFSVPGSILKIRKEQIQVIEYRTVKSAAIEAEKISADGSRIGASMINWVAPPHFFKSGRLIVLYVGGDLGVIKLLENALGGQFAGK